MLYDVLTTFASLDLLVRKNPSSANAKSPRPCCAATIIWSATGRCCWRTRASSDATSRGSSPRTLERTWCDRTARTKPPVRTIRRHQPMDRVRLRNPQEPARPRRPQRARRNEAVGARGGHLAQLESQRTPKTLPDRLRPLNPIELNYLVFCLM